MTSICHKCRFSFEETTTQYYKRSKTNSLPICRDCSRISNAEEAAQKREKLASQSPTEILFKKAKFLKHLYGNVSAPLLMRKFNLSFTEAKTLAENIN